MSRWLSRTFLAVLSLALLTTFAGAAQTSVSSSDLQRLDDSVARLRTDVDALRARDTALARSLERELTDLGEEVTYLKVKLRREGTVARTEYTDLSGRITALERRVRGDVASESSTPPAETTNRSRRAGEIPVGQELDVRLQSSLSSDTAQVEDRFEATTLVDMLEGERVLIPAGSTMRGVVKAVQSAGRIDRKASLTLAFDQVTIKGRDYPIRATVTQALESGGYRQDAGRIGTGAAVGAIIGGILGGFKGAMAGVLIGGGGTVIATEGKDVKLDVGTVLRVRFDEPLVVERAREG
jgi:hypothetical protein